MVTAETPLVAYAGSGDTYAITFDYDADTEIAVAWFDATGARTDLVNPTTFTISGSNVVTDTSYADGTVVIYRVTPDVQGTDYEYNGSLGEDALEANLDAVWRRLQEITEELARCIKLDRDRAGDLVVIPSETPTGTLGLDGSGVTVS